MSYFFRYNKSSKETRVGAAKRLRGVHSGGSPECGYGQ